MGFTTPQRLGYPAGGPQNKDYKNWGFILGSPIFENQHLEDPQH